MKTTMKTKTIINGSALVVWGDSPPQDAECRAVFHGRADRTKEDLLFSKEGHILPLTDAAKPKTAM